MLQRACPLHHLHGWDWLYWIVTSGRGIGRLVSNQPLLFVLAPRHLCRLSSFLPYLNHLSSFFLSLRCLSSFIPCLCCLSSFLPCLCCLSSFLPCLLSFFILTLSLLPFFIPTLLVNPLFSAFFYYLFFRHIQAVAVLCDSQQFTTVKMTKHCCLLPGDSEVQRTMLELLNQLDGFEPKQNIKVNSAFILSASMWGDVWSQFDAMGFIWKKISGCLNRIWNTDLNV